MAQAYDFAVIGGGIAGASVAAHLARHGRVVILERESQPGYHSTGRSAAMFTETYGNHTIRALTRASRAFLETPPDGFADHPLLRPRGLLLAAPADQSAALAGQYDELRALCPDLQRLDGAQARALVPCLRPGAIATALFEPSAREIDVHALLGGYLAMLRAAGGKILTNAEVTELRRDGGVWIIETRAGRMSASVVVNAAGAWADEIAGLAGLEPLGITPKRRTVFMLDLPPQYDGADWPLTILADESLYFRPDGGGLLVSPADETPTPPCDAQPEEYDVALGVERFVKLTDIAVDRVAHKWAGLRSFAADKCPVVGIDPAADGFFWLAGQGGYGVHTADAMARLGCALATSSAIPGDIASLGVNVADLSPTRLRR